MPDNADAAAEANAALSICESLLIALREKGVLEKSEVNGLLEDVVTSHEAHEAVSIAPDHHRRVVEMTRAIMRGENALRVLDR